MPPFYFFSDCTIITANGNVNRFDIAFNGSEQISMFFDLKGNKITNIVLANTQIQSNKDYTKGIVIFGADGKIFTSGQLQMNKQPNLSINNIVNNNIVNDILTITFQNFQ